VEDVQKHIFGGLALIEFAVVAMSIVVLKCETLPDDVFKIAEQRALSILIEAVKRQEGADRPRLSVVGD